ncbi:hypothetical protein Moror_9840 [Moniliophthora roreri MCA 2997]|uniref:Thioesterase domain-containing protein n=2 Tax=Moniliophthora roreri TaxID=221103 RepID=V2X222_MONRO|nr:hypothetical protein Moror_9840 [Moniliophthora roreri MCA 2997]KAI3598433.1 hypothetical protein WG66_000708 [Moniliophthora roreri]
MVMTTVRSESQLVEHTLPPTSSIRSGPSNYDVSTIKGNISDEAKRFVLDLFYYYVGTQDGCFGASVGRRLKLVEAEILLRNGKASQGRTVFEVDIERDMCNPLKTLHGACATYLVGPCTISTLGLLGAALGIDGTGVSQSVNVTWHQPAKMGCRLRVVSTSIFINGRIRTSHCELWDKDQDVLCISAIHSTVNTFRSTLDRAKM